MEQRPRDLAEGQATLQAILENAVDAIVTIDQRGVVQSANSAVERIFGYHVDEVVGRNVNMLMPSPDREQHDQYIARYLDTGERKIIGIGREVRGQRKDGTTFPLHLAVSEIKVGERLLFTGIARDVSDLKRAEARLARLNEELEQRVRQRTAELREAQAELVQREKLATLGKVSGGIAHEIRNPLNAVKTSAYYLLHAKNPSEAKVREHLQRIDRQVSLIDNVITALSDVAKMPDPCIDQWSLRECLDKVLTTTDVPANIQIDNRLPDDLPPAFADQQQLSIVFRNLIRNARDAMPQGGRLLLTGESRNQSVMVSVQDNGVGIRPEDMQRIAEPLFSTKARGMGLGLAISKVILDKNQGELTVASELGRGSAFTVTLPVASQSHGI